MSLERGHAVEAQVKAYLMTQGLQWIQSHYRSPMGEIDLIMQEAETLVFVEVRYRQTGAFGSALESVTSAKQRRLWGTASHYLSVKRLHDRVPTRFDVVGVQGGAEPSIEWIKDAFRRGWM